MGVSEQEDPSIFAQRFSRSYRLRHLIACRVFGDEERAPLAIKNYWRSASRNPSYFEYYGAFKSWLVRVRIDEAPAILRKRQEENDPAWAVEEFSIAELNKHSADEYGADRSVLSRKYARGTQRWQDHECLR